MNCFERADRKMKFIEEFYPRLEPVYSSYRDEDEYEEEEEEEEE